MLISLTHRFIFVANLKTASTSIEEALNDYAQISLRQSEFGKHWRLYDIEKHFSWVYTKIPREQMFIFGVIRDPVQYMTSLYNSHRDDKFRSRPNLYTGNISFPEFLDSWVKSFPDLAAPQHQRFLDIHGRIGVDYLIEFEKLSDQISEVANIINIPNIYVPHLNRSDNDVTQEIDETCLNKIINDYNDDYVFMDKYCGKILRNFI